MAAAYPGVEQSQSMSATDYQEKDTGTAYVAEIREGRTSRRSSAERSLILKIDLIVIPLATLIFFVAYLVSSTWKVGLLREITLELC